MSVDAIKFIVLQELRHHHVGAANAISREALFGYVTSCFPDQEDDRDMRQAIAESPEICWRQGRGYFIAAERGEVEEAAQDFAFLPRFAQRSHRQNGASLSQIL